MKALANVQIGWKWLSVHLNAIIDGVNARSIIVPLNGGLDIQETQNGTLLSLSKNGPDNVGWQSINVIDDSTGTCVTKTITYWGTPPA